MAKFSRIFTAIVGVIGFLLFAIFEILRGILLLFVPASYEPVKGVAGEIVLVTGAGSGLGRQLAIRLAKKQARVVIWDINVKGLEETHKMIKDVGGIVHSYKCDLTNREEIYQVAEKVKKDVGDVTILVNNAGVVSGYFVLDTPDHLIQRTFDVNSLALFWVSLHHDFKRNLINLHTTFYYFSQTAKAFMPKMVELNRGHVVTIASMAGHMACPKLCDYSASKYAAYGFDEGLRLDLQAKGITGIKTTVICPMFIAQTGMFDDVVTRSRRLTLDEVADRTILGILREDIVVMIPASMRVTFWLKW
ncbi:pksb [Holotrichia oblita]|uniref:Pksb n=1 Tax=Holotrichia oblita TaxID=644536 RepID=A0ACB9SPZ6_HOLOL|nr:pksb [Holotrichia oblita]